MSLRISDIVANTIIKAGGTSSQILMADGSVSTNPGSWITGYTETDTLASVTGRGSSTSTAVTFSGGITVSGTGYYTFNKPSTSQYQTVALFGTTGGGIFITSDNAIISKGAYYNNGWIATATAGSLIDFTANSNNPGIATFTGATVGNAVTFSTTYKIWHEGNLTNLNQLTNGPGYITSAGNAATATNASQLSGYTLDGATSIATRIFNNKGQVHSTYTNFNTVMTPGPNYIQGPTNGPTGTAGGQWYGMMFGLGSEYGTSTGTAGHYASQLYYSRVSQDSNQYLWARDMENGTWGSWRKLFAGYADTAGALSSGNKSINGNLYVTGGNPSQIILSNTNSELYVSAGAGTARLIINRESNGTQSTLVFTTGATVTQGTAWAGTGSPYTMGMTNSSQVNDFKFAVGDIYDSGSLVYRIDTSKNMYIYGSRLYNDGGTQYVYNSGTWSINITGNATTATTSTQTYRGIIEDTRAAQRTPNAYDDYRVSWEFTNQMPHDSNWLSIMTMQGWHDGYAAWQIQGPATTSAQENWYLRSGVNTGWNSARTIIHSGNIGSQSVNYANYSGYSRRIISEYQEWDFGTGSHSTNPMSISIYDNYTQAGAPSSYGTLVDIYGLSGHQHDQLYFAQGSLKHRYGWYGNNNWSGWNEIITASNISSYTIPIGGSWYGVNTPGSRWGGYAVNGGEIVFGRDLPNNGQMGMLVDGAYLAGENNGFWSLPSNNDWNGRRGMYWDGSYLNFTTNTPTARFQYIRADDGVQANYFYQKDNTDWYLAPGADLSLRVYGEISNSNFSQGNMQPGALNIGRTDTNYRWDGGTWASDVRLGILANCSEYWEIGIHDSGDSVMSALYFDGGSTITIGRNLGWGTCSLTVAGDITAFSDARVKENIKPIENALEKTLSLQGVSYNRTDSQDKRTKIGLIAQEVKEVVPEIVTEVDGGLYGVSYGNAVGLLIEAIKEQQKQIEELKSQIKNQ